MKPEDSIIRMLQALEDRNIRATNEFEKDIVRLVNSDVKDFIRRFYKEITRADLILLKKYERLKLNHIQNEKMNGNSLFRYEYRKTSNLRCIYVIKNEESSYQNIILLCAFNEDAGKVKGKGAYNFNIERAIKIYQDLN